MGVGGRSWEAQGWGWLPAVWGPQKVRCLAVTILEYWMVFESGAPSFSFCAMQIVWSALPRALEKRPALSPRGKCHLF